MCIVIFMMKTRTDAMHVVKVVSRQKGREYVSYLLRNSYREGGKVRKQTLANLSHLPEPLIDLIRGWLRGERYLESGAALAIVRSLPHGHVAAVLGMLRFLGLETLLDRRPSRSRDLAVALIVARLVSPCSKLATARTLGQSTLWALLGVEGASADELYGALDWLLARQARVERSLARRHLSDGSLVLYDLTSTYLEGSCCPLAAHGHSRDQRPDRAQIELGLVTDVIGDVFGQPGREALLRWLPGFREERAVDFVIANGENAANGAGITSKLALKMLGGGVDVITMGNHVWRQKEVYSFLATDERIVRPANYPAGSPGRGLTVRPAADGGEVAVINLAGELFMNTGMSPFRIVDRLVEEAEELADAIVVDLHAEATSEKVAMGHYLDGRVTAVLGTHTHVQTSDAHVLAGGTAYMTDVGMTGPLESVIGVRTDIIVRRFLTELPAQFEVADGPVRLDAALVSAEGGLATAIEALEVIM